MPFSLSEYFIHIKTSKAFSLSSNNIGKECGGSFGSYTISHDTVKCVIHSTQRGYKVPSLMLIKITQLSLRSVLSKILVFLD